MHRYEEAVVRALLESKSASLDELLSKTGLAIDALTWALEMLKEKGIVSIEKSKEERLRLTQEGEAYAKGLLPEEQLLKRLENGPISIAELKGKEEQIGLKWLKEHGLVKIEKGMLILVSHKPLRAGELLRALVEGKESLAEAEQKDREALDELLKRHLISIEEKQQIRQVTLVKAPKLEATQNAISQLTKDMIKQGTWQQARFLPYNINAEVEEARPAREHILRRVINQLRLAYLANGFTEVKGPIVESSFWVFDYLFVPQDHPAREMQDTFFTSSPETIEVKEKEEMRRIKQVHEKSWRSSWSEEVAKQAVLRTHTTSVSARQIFKVVKSLSKNAKAYTLPLKFFTIGRVFRNENPDSTHLADFYQTDGIIIGRELTLAQLFDTLLRIYKSIGLEVKFKPSYFPFVEPGVEVDMKFGDEWLEMGGAGIIREEVVGSSKINVLAWGLGVERIVLAKNKGIGSIANLYNAGIGWLRENSL